jgi:hypothetical protein
LLPLSGYRPIRRRLLRSGSRLRRRLGLTSPAEAAWRRALPVPRCWNAPGRAIRIASANSSPLDQSSALARSTNSHEISKGHSGVAFPRELDPRPDNTLVGASNCSAKNAYRALRLRRIEAGLSSPRRSGCRRRPIDLGLCRGDGNSGAKVSCRSTGRIGSCPIDQFGCLATRHAVKRRRRSSILQVCSMRREYSISVLSRHLGGAIHADIVTPPQGLARPTLRDLCAYGSSEI